MEDVLLPCPFCMGEAQRFIVGDDAGAANVNGEVICCQACGASSHVEFGRKENLVSAWNRRVIATSQLVPAQRLSAYPSVTRVEVIDHVGDEPRAYHRSGDISVSVDLQDGGRTLKVFVEPAQPEGM